MARMYSLTVALSLACIAINVGSADANKFLGQVPVHLESNLELEHVILSELEGALGNEHRTFTEKRLKAIKSAAQPIFQALPKNENGKLGSATTSYALYRVFLARHAWFVIGLEPFKAMASWNTSSPTSILDQRVPEFITGLFTSRLFKSGFGVHELSVLAATIEHFVHKESLVRLNTAYRSLGFSQEDSLGEEEVETVMDNYMTLYLLSPLVRNMSTVSASRVQGLRANITRLYPNFPDTQQFLRDVQQSVSPNRDHFYYSEVASLVEEVGDRYGRWQDYECRDLKDSLVEMEDPSTGGAGRVRLADFYNAALNKGKWQFTESVHYLRQLGALDESNPDNLRLIIANYINGPSNCAASSNYYSVCCLNECDELLGHIEAKVAAPVAEPERILALVAALPSSTLPGNRTLSTWLTHRLNEVAKHHGGMIPLHGRLFGQWMHYAFPRECTFPHVLGATKPQTPQEYLKEARRDLSTNKTVMQYYVSLPVPHQRRATETGELEELLSMESAMWTMEEELVVAHTFATPTQRPYAPWFRGGVFVAVIISTLVALKNSVDTKLTTVRLGNEKYFV